MVCARSAGSCGQHCVEVRRIFRHLVTFPSLKLSLCGRLRRQMGLGNCVGSWYAASAVLMVTCITLLTWDSCSKQSYQASRRNSFQFGRSRGMLSCFCTAKKNNAKSHLNSWTAKVKSGLVGDCFLGAVWRGCIGFSCGTTRPLFVRDNCAFGI